MNGEGWELVREALNRVLAADIYEQLTFEES